MLQRRGVEPQVGFDEACQVRLNGNDASQLPIRLSAMGRRLNVRQLVRRKCTCLLRTCFQVFQGREDEVIEKREEFSKLPGSKKPGPVPVFLTVQCFIIGAGGLAGKGSQLPDASNF